MHLQYNFSINTKLGSVITKITFILKFYKSLHLSKSNNFKDSSPALSRRLNDKNLQPKRLKVLQVERTEKMSNLLILDLEKFDTIIH